MTTLHIKNIDGTVRLGNLIAAHAKPGDVIGLKGDLGAGKTFLAGIMAHGLGVAEKIAVTSPTFTLINEYHGKIPIYHMDLYRLGDPDELYELGLWEYYDGEGICLVEWCDRFDDLWPNDALVITIELEGDEGRLITLDGQGRGAKLAGELAAAWP